MALHKLSSAVRIFHHFQPPKILVSNRDYFSPGLNSWVSGEGANGFPGGPQVGHLAHVFLWNQVDFLMETSCEHSKLCLLLKFWGKASELKSDALNLIDISSVSSLASNSTWSALGNSTAFGDIEDARVHFRSCDKSLWKGRKETRIMGQSIDSIYHIYDLYVYYTYLYIHTIYTIYSNYSKHKWMPSGRSFKFSGSRGLCQSTCCSSSKAVHFRRERLEK